MSPCPAVKGDCDVVAARRRPSAGWRWAIAVASVCAAGCDVNTALERLTDARRLSADLLIQFSRAADASNRAVMADTDEQSVAFAGEAEQAKKAVQKDMDALRPILQGLGYSAEARLVDEFLSRFAQYQALDRTILDLTVDSTNLKAQRL